MLDWNQCPTVERVPGKVSGVWLFKGTRVPVKALFENLEDGAGVDDFLRRFPGVKREQVLAVLEFAEQSLTVAQTRNLNRVAHTFRSGTPVPLRRYLLAHTVATAFEMGWAEFSNGNLLFEAEAQFDVLVTTDQNLRLSAKPWEPEARHSRFTLRKLASKLFKAESLRQRFFHLLRHV